MKNFWKYLQKLGDVSNPNSSKSFALLVSTLTGGVIALVICFILIYDVIQNNHIETSLSELGIFLLCVGGYIAGSGVTKAISERFNSAKHETESPEDEE